MPIIGRNTPRPKPQTDLTARVNALEAKVDALSDQLSGLVNALADEADDETTAPRELDTGDTYGARDPNEPL